MPPPTGSSLPLALLSLTALPLSGVLVGADSDCNRNGRPDHEDLESRSSLDCNRNGNPDECDVLPVNLSLAVTRTLDVLNMTAVAIADLDGDGIADLTGSGFQGRPQVSFHWGQGTGGFSAGSPVNTGTTFRFIAAADTDRDGDPDVVTAGFKDISVLLNDGDRRFRLAHTLTGAISPQSVVTGDLDGDGDLDLAVDGEFQVLVFLQEEGAFNEGTSILVGSDPTALAGGDLDGDGDLDLASANLIGGNVSIFTNRGDATFEAARNFAAGEATTWILAADLDGDRDLDLAVSHDSAVSVFRNRGDGSFDPPEGHALSAVPFTLQAADLDGDQDLDLIADQRSLEGHSSLTSLWNHGNGRFASGHEPFDLDQGLPAVGDLDGDGGLEAAVRSRDRSSVLFLETARETYSDDCNQDGAPDECHADCNANGIPDDCDTRSSASADCNANEVPDECEADCNRNGAPDDCDLAGGGAADCNRNGIPDSCDLSGTFQLATAQDFEGLTRVAQDMAFADVDGDLDLDLAFAAPGEVALFRNLDGAFREDPVIESGVFTRDIEVLDLERDGDVDFVLAGSNRVVALENAGRGRFSPRDLFTFAGTIVSTLALDIDADGDGDLAALGSPEPLLILQNENGTFAEGATYAPGGSAGWCVAAPLDPDGLADLAVLHHQGVSVFRARGDGSLEQPREFALDSRAEGLVAADLDRDGDSDLAAAAPAGVLVLLNDGAGGFAAPVTREMQRSRNGGLVAAADLDLDGDADLLDLGVFAFPASVLLNDGRADFKRVPHAGVEGFDRLATAAALGDIDGDGDLDLATGGRLSCLHCLVTDPGLLRIEENLSNPPRSGDTNRDGVPDECGRAVFHRGDPDGDGRIDIADPIFILNALFLGGRPASCRESADANNDGELDLTDPVHLLRYLFLGGPEPAAPGPASLPCGPDPDPPGSAGDLGCASYGGCA